MRRAGNTLLSVFAGSKRVVTGVSGFVDTLGKGSLDYSLLLLEPFLPARFPGSSMVEHSAVNRRVASSNLARGATFRLNQLAREGSFFISWLAIRALRRSANSRTESARMTQKLA